MGGINFSKNDYGITRQEWRAIKKDLKNADKLNDNFKLTNADYKEMKASIKSGDLSAYLDRQGADLKQAMGLSLTGRVDGTEDLQGATNIVNDVDFAIRPDGKQTDKAKVIQYIKNANVVRIAQGVDQSCANIEETGVKGHLTGSLLGEAFTA
jgi:hypothetical protein